MTKALTKLPQILHGGDYNPEQWSRDVWDEDIHLMKLAGVNAVSLGIFAWSKLEVSEGNYDFSWLDDIIEKLSSADISFVLATPSAATPQWMSENHPETLRVRHDGLRHPHKVRVNYCLSSPVYRQACKKMASALAQRYGQHKNLLLWHINNEYYNDCHCNICQDKFRDWLKNRYGSLEALNHAWWTPFWSHTYNEWSQVRSPQPWPDGEWSVQSMSIDWKRFTGDQYAELFTNEAEAIREHSSDVPLTHNMHALLNNDLTTQWKKVSPLCDFVSWDNYPGYQDDAGDVQRAITCAFQHDVYRGLNNGNAYMVMEGRPASGPGTKHQRKGILRRTGIQGLAHGSDSVMYFQWRDGRGGIEKFHGSMTRQYNSENTRAFGEISKLGNELHELSAIIGSEIPSDIAILFDQEIHWSLEYTTSARFDERDYIDSCLAHYAPLWQAGVNTTVVPPEYDLSQYKVVIAPLLHLLTPEAIENLRNYVEQGGCLVLTYWSGYVNESDLVFTSPAPGPLAEIAGVYSEELDAIPAGESFAVNSNGKQAGLADNYKAIHFADYLHSTGAEVLATFDDGDPDYLQGRPALSKNTFGKGSCYYIGFMPEADFLSNLYNSIIDEAGVQRAVSNIPSGINVLRRCNETTDFLFVHSFSQETETLDIGEGWSYVACGEKAESTLSLEKRAAVVLQRAK
ncbi:MAG: beta-galactosidase [Planctomycetes bacterium]|nr:beta-galactosidase [Planctomycetota bacterium]